MNKQKRSVLKLVTMGLIAFATYSMLNHWSDIKRGFMDGVNDGHATAMKAK